MGAIHFYIFFFILQLSRAGVALFANATAINEYADYRISKSTIFADDDHKYIADISKRTSDMSGLSTKSADKLHIVNYGIGGFYDTHFDFALNTDLTFENQGVGNRIATILFYVNYIQFLL